MARAAPKLVKAVPGCALLGQWCASAATHACEELRRHELDHQFRPSQDQALLVRQDADDARTISGTNARPAAQMIFHRDLVAALHVCPHCGHHMRIGAAARRLELLFDDGSFDRIELPKVRARSAAVPRRASAIPTGCKRAAGQDRRAGRDHRRARHHRRPAGGDRGASISISWAARWAWRWATGLIAAARPRVRRRRALIVIPASGGARMQEGILSLMQMPRTHHRRRRW